MSTWFADASVLLARADSDDPEHEASIALLGGAAPVATLDLAYYEVANAAIRAWDDPAKARRLRGLVTALADDGGLVRVDEALAAAAADLASEHGLSAYDAAYVAGAAAAGARLVSCDLRDLVRPGLAVTPSRALAL